MDFLVLFKNGPGDADLEVAGLIVNKRDSEGPQAIEEAMTKGAGTYIAVPFDTDSKTERLARATLELTDAS